QHSIDEPDRDRAARVALADDARDERDGQPRHQRLGAGDRTALPVLLRRDARVGARRVEERGDRESVPLRDLHQAHPLAIPLRMRHSEVAARALVDVATLLLADQGDRPAAEAREAGHERWVLRSGSVTVQLDVVLEEAL